MTTEAAGQDYVETVVRVRYAETDQMGVAYYANYFVWFEVGRSAWCHARGFSYREMEEKDGRMLVVAEANCRYKEPARYDDEILIRTTIAGASEKVIRFAYELRNKRTDSLLAMGETIHVITNAQMQSERLPKRFRAYFGLRPGRGGREAASVPAACPAGGPASRTSTASPAWREPGTAGACAPAAGSFSAPP
ncbi:MAG: acyl-CoA thioesterase [Acidobacteria bacterium]|nr:acyl-CoA thioesterase [Acidobacteriota bacterium]